MTYKGRLTLDLPLGMVETLREMAVDKGVTVTHLTRVALNLFMIASGCEESGQHLGLVKDVRKLDTRLLHLI